MNRLNNMIRLWNQRIGLSGRPTSMAYDYAMRTQHMYVKITKAIRKGYQN